MGRRGWLVTALLAVVTGSGAILLLAGRDDAQQGLAALPALTDLAAVPDDQLLTRVQAELARRCAGDRARLPEALRRLWAVEAGEGPLRQRGLLEAALLEASHAPTTHRPSLAELAEAYRALELSAAAAVLEEAGRLAASEGDTLAAWAAYDLADPNRGPAPRNPFSALDGRFRAAVAGSPARRLAWIRAHAAEVAAAH
jgi:hypothetical protein